MVSCFNVHACVPCVHFSVSAVTYINAEYSGIILYGLTSSLIRIKYFIKYGFIRLYGFMAQGRGGARG